VRLLIVGGSLGAKTLNDLVVAALATLPKEQRPEIVHQSGEKNYDELVSAYRHAAVDATVLPFIDDMSEKYAWCDVMLCRAGAITVAELAVAGVASVLVPLPFFVAEEQLANAHFLADAGAGVLVKQLETAPPTLADLVKNLTREKLLAMATKARSLGKPDATESCANVCLELVA
jgi:UDP-N-acetylglucosamine--N-acetylmuramyl-(pentapeptide) pyrophosphoryl-undecaprenol N-acetylglucosamine transferase